MTAESIASWLRNAAPKIGAAYAPHTAPDRHTLTFLETIHCQVRYSAPDERIYFFAPLEIPDVDARQVRAELLLEANRLAVGLGGMAFYHDPETDAVMLSQSVPFRFLNEKEFTLFTENFLLSAAALWEFIFQALAETDADTILPCGNDVPHQAWQ